MKLGQYLKLLMLVGLAAMLGCGDSSSDSNDIPPPSSGNNPSIAPAGVYVMTNTPISNSIREFIRSADGSLTFVDDFTTGGNGDGTDLEGTAGSLVFQANTNRFYAVNAGSNTISAMVLGTDGEITVLSTVTSNGVRPVSIAAYNDLVYVLNYGDANTNQPANISGYRMVGAQLVPINGSTQVLSAANPDPFQIGFHTSGTVLVVTERATNNITTFRVDSNGTALPGVAQGSNGNTPGGIDFSPNGLLVVAEANDNNVGAGSSSVYIVGQDGTLTDLSVSVDNGQTGTGHARVFPNAPFVFYTNSLSDTISTYNLDANGGLTLLGNGAAANTGFGPTDLGVSYDALYLYTLDQAEDTISTFSIAANGSLNAINGPTPIPANSVGMVVR
jgi:6-phosphogluconolactonase (cycloisomerase 2 family)